MKQCRKCCTSQRAAPAIRHGACTLSCERKKKELSPHPLQRSAHPKVLQVQLVRQRRSGAAQGLVTTTVCDAVATLPARSATE